jgi:hypothetical protein
MPLDHRPEAFDRDLGRRRIGRREQDHELLAAGAGHQDAGPDPTSGPRFL